MTRYTFIIHFHTILSICKYEKILLLDSMTNLWAKKKVILPKSRSFLRGTPDCELLYFGSCRFYMRNNGLFRHLSACFILAFARI